MHTNVHTYPHTSYMHAYKYLHAYIIHTCIHMGNVHLVTTPSPSSELLISPTG